MPGPILVPLDGSGFAEEALPRASEIATRLHEPVQLALVHAVAAMLPETVPGGAPHLDAHFRVDEQVYLEQLARRLSEEAGVAVTTVILDGPVAPTLIDHVRSRNPQLVVMTTHGRGGLSRLFLGSVADRLIRTLHCPLLLVHAGNALATPEAGEPRHILVPLDGSALAESVIDQVLGAFGREEMVIELVQIAEPHHEVFIGGDAPLAAAGVMEQRLLAPNRYLHAVAVRLRQLRIKVHAEVRIERSVAHGILGYAESHQCELIAVATRGLGGLERVLLGSVADKLVRSARVPLLVWNPPPAASSKVLLSTVKTAAEPALAAAAG